MDAIIDNGTASSLVELSSNVVQLVALLVDTWLGCCIMNHDAKQTNSKQLDKGLIFFPLCHGEIKMLLQRHSSSTQEESVGVAAQNGQVLIACLENAACMISELLAFTGGGETNAEDNQKLVGHLAVSILSENSFCQRWCSHKLRARHMASTPNNTQCHRAISISAVYLSIL